MDILVITAIGVFFAGVTILYQTHPHLRESTITDHPEGKFTITVQNTGKGIAIIKNMSIIAYGDSTEDHENDEFVDEMARLIDMQGKPNIEFYVWDKGDHVPSGEELKVFEAKIPKDDNDLKKSFTSLSKNIAVTAKYRSVIGLPFTLKSRERKI